MSAHESPNVRIGGRRGHERGRRYGIVLHFLERRLAARGTHAVNLALREHGAQPGPQAAPSVEVSEERTPLPIAFLQSEEIGVNRIGQLARAAGGIDGVGRAVEHRSVLAYEMIPRAFRALGTGAGECQVREVQGRQVTLESLLVLRPVRQRLGGALLERGRERSLGHTPSRGLSLLIKARDEGRVYPNGCRRLSGHDPGRALVGRPILPRAGQWAAGGPGTRAPAGRDSDRVMSA